MIGGCPRPWQVEEAHPSDARSRRAATGSPPAPHGAPEVFAPRREARRAQGVRPSPRRRQPVPADSAGRDQRHVPAERQGLPLAATCAAIATASPTLNPGSATRATIPPISTTVPGERHSLCARRDPRTRQRPSGSGHPCRRSATERRGSSAQCGSQSRGPSAHPDRQRGLVRAAFFISASIAAWSGNVSMKYKTVSSSESTVTTLVPPRASTSGRSSTIRRASSACFPRLCLEPDIDMNRLGHLVLSNGHRSSAEVVSVRP